MKTEAEMIKKLDNRIRNFIGGTDIQADRIFNDPDKYKKIANQFWNQEIVKKKA